MIGHFEAVRDVNIAAKELALDGNLRAMGPDVLCPYEPSRVILFRKFICFTRPNPRVFCEGQNQDRQALD